MQTNGEQDWQALGLEVLTGLKEWRLAHPTATLREIEIALDERLGRLRAKLLEEAAQMSAATDWQQRESPDHPHCPDCGTPLVPRGRHRRQLQTTGGQAVVLERQYGTCPTCGCGLFPPG